MKKLVFLACIVLSCKAPVQEPMDKLGADITQAIEARIENGYTPSMAIAFIDSTGTYYYNFGKIESVGETVNKHTIYEIGSITKVFTGILLAQQIINGQLSADDHVNQFLPDEAQIPSIDGNQITLGQLVDHSSGLPGIPTNFASANTNNPYVDYSKSHLYEFLSGFQPNRTAGSKYEYSNLATGLLGHLLAKNNDMSYEDLLLENIAGPLEMEDTKITLTKDMKERLAKGHNAGKTTANWDFDVLAGAGAIRSTTSDMAKFISANLGYLDSPLKQALNLSHELRHDMADGRSVAMAWHIDEGVNGDVIWHNGGTGGYRSFCGFVKETGQGVVILTNSSQSSDDIGFKILDPSAKLKQLKFKKDALELPEATIKEYVGTYEFMPGFTMTISKEGKQLYGEISGQDKFEIYAESETEFFLTVVQAKISFQRNEGEVESLVFQQAGQEMVGKKIEN